MRSFLILCSTILLLLAACSEEKRVIKVACIGDSITEGCGISYQSHNSYPARLDSILGDGYQVMNLGRSSTTLMQNGDFPYWSAKEFNNALAYKADIQIIKLGTNDIKLYQWNPVEYEKSYQALIDTLLSVNPTTKLYLCYPIPVRKTQWEITDSLVTSGAMPIIDKIAQKNNLPIIDMYSLMKDKQELIFDNVHPDAKGTLIMAQYVAECIRK